MNIFVCFLETSTQVSPPAPCPQPRRVPAVACQTHLLKLVGEISLEEHTRRASGQLARARAPRLAQRPRDLRANGGARAEPAPDDAAVCGADASGGVLSELAIAAAVGIGR